MKRVYRGLKRYGHEALRGHVLQTAQEGRSRHPDLSAPGAVLALIQDEAVVRYPTDLVFDASRLSPGFFAEVEAQRASGTGTATLIVHPHFEGRGLDLAYLVAYHVPAINYGKMASHEDAEAFGATLLGVDVETYYARVCALADELA